MQASVSRWVTYWSGVRPDDAAVVFQGTTTTWAELERSMERGARSLAAVGVGPGDRVAVLLSNRPEFYETFFAIARLGAVFVAVNTRSSPSEVAYLLGDSGTAVLVTERDFAEVVGAVDLGACRLVDVDGQFAPDLDHLDGDRPADLALPDFDDLIAILYTSGTTGRPKGAMLTHAAFHFSALNLVLAYEMTQRDRHLVVLPLCFTGGILTLSQPVFLSGGTIVLEPAFDPARTLDVLTAQQVTVWFSAPALLQLLRLNDAFRPEAFESLRLIVAGAAPVPEALLTAYQALGVDVGQGYGLTEGGAVETFLLARDATRKIGSVGRPCMFTDARVVDANGASVRAGTRGEIQLRGPNMMAGYWRNEEATAAAFDDGWLRTGDVGVLDDEGYLTVVDRLKDMVITGGMNVYPAEVEAAIFQHPAVAEAAVVGVPHDVYGETVVAIIVLRPGAELTLEDLRAHCAEHVADYKVPRALQVVDALPRNTSGKVLKHALRDQVTDAMTAASNAS